MKKLSFIFLMFMILCLLGFHCLQAQVKIGGTPGPPNSSAILELESSSRGMLVPRLTTTQRNAIASPAKGLLVYDSTVKAYYYHDGAAWQPFAKAGPDGTGWTTTGNTGTNPSTNFIGTTDKQNFAIRTNNAERVRVDTNGNVGIGTTTPHAPLQLSNVLGNRKLVLWESGDNDHQFYGFGVNGGTLRYQSQDSHVFYRGVDANNSAEMMRINASGQVGMGGIVPDFSAALDVTSTSRGVLIPRLTTTQRNAIVFPAKGLLVYDSTVKGFYYHDGAAWQPFAKAGPDGSGWSTTGNTGTNPSTNFIGTADKQNVAIRTNNIERVRVDSNGNVGIGTATPHALLQFPNTLDNRKLVLWESGNNDNQFYGFGVNPYGLRYQSNSAHVFYTAVDADNSTEQMRITNAGNVGIGNDAPHSSALLDITSTSKGVLVPRLTTAQRNAIGSPGKGLLVYDSTVKAYYYHDGAAWQPFATGGSAGTGWSTTGNTGTNPSTNYIGTTDAQPLVVRTNSTEKLRINTNGEIAGTGAAPTFLGFKYQNTSPAAGASSDFYAIANNGNNTSHYIDMGINGSGGGIAPFTGANHAYLYSVQDSLHIGALGTGNAINFYTGGGINTPAKRMLIAGNGNVGIGTSSPGAKLEINNGTTAGAIKIVDGTQGAGKVLVSDANGVGTWSNKPMGTTYTQYILASVPAGQSVTTPVLPDTYNSAYKLYIAAGNACGFNFLNEFMLTGGVPYDTWLLKFVAGLAGNGATTVTGDGSKTITVTNPNSTCDFGGGSVANTAQFNYIVSLNGTGSRIQITNLSNFPNTYVIHLYQF
jgi:hypothetical protein